MSDDSAKKREIPVLFTAEEIRLRVERMAREIADAMPQDVMVISLLKGSFIFTADLVRALHGAGLQPQIDFMTLSSYGASTQSTGEIKVNRDLAEEVAGRHVLLVDDILESGRTLQHAAEVLKGRGAASIKIAVLLEKPGKRDLAVQADFLGFTIPDRFVVGYGLDYANFYRELPYIGVIELH